MAQPPTLPSGFVPVFTYRFPLDRLLLPFIDLLAPRALISLPELLHRGQRPLPQAQLLLDSGGYAALDPRSKVIQESGLGTLILPSGDKITPQDVYDAQLEHGCVAFSLDFPGGQGAERKRRRELSLSNARWHLSQPRLYPTFASVQPGQALGPFLELEPEGIALGGLAPLSSQRDKLRGAIANVRQQIGDLPLHVFGLGHPESVRVAFEAGATSVDSTSPQRTAVAGKSFGGVRLPHPSPAETLELAVNNLREVLGYLPAPPQLPHSTPTGLRASSHALPELLEDDHGALLTWATGHGKTWAACRVAAEVLPRQKVLVVVPLQALAAQVAQDWQAALPHSSVQAYTSSTRNKQPYRKADVICLTPERLDYVTRNWRKHADWLAQVGLLVVDEFHLIGDAQRGGTLDAALTRIRLISPLARLLAMTATCGNPEVVSAWLGARHYDAPHRLNPLDWQVCEVKDGAAKKEAWLRLLRQQSPETQTLTFVHSRAKASQFATELQRAGLCAAAHHAGLMPAERETTEQRFRAGEVQHLICTPTLELGLNLPADHVLLYDLRHHEGGVWHNITRNAAWQRAGRAGRTAERGARVTVLGASWESPHAYPLPFFEPLESPLLQGHALTGFILGSLDAGMVRTEAQIKRLLKRTFAGHGKRAKAEEALGQLIRDGALTRSASGELAVTPLGRVASQHLLNPAQVAAVSQLPPAPSVFDVLFLASTHIPPMRLNLAAYAALRLRLPELPSWLLHGRDDVWHTQHEAPLFTALCVHACCLDTAERVAHDTGLFQPDLNAAREAALRVVRAWQAYQPSARLGLIQTMLAAEVDLCGATLGLLSGVGRVGIRQLQRAGVPELEVLATMTPAALEACGVPAAKAAKLIGQAELKVKQLGEDPTRESAPRISLNALPEAVDAVRLERARHLKVEALGEAFKVTGGSEARTVTPEERCTCPDHQTHRLCKHVLAVRLFRGVALH